MKIAFGVVGWSVALVPKKEMQIGPGDFGTKRSIVREQGIQRFRRSAASQGDGKSSLLGDGLVDGVQEFVRRAPRNRCGIRENDDLALHCCGHAMELALPVI